MDIFDILREAKSPSKPTGTVLKVSTNDSTDYTEDTDTNDEATTIDATPDNQEDSTDYTAEVEEVEPEDDNTDDSTDNEDDESNDEATDYTDNLDTDEDDANSEDQATDYTEDVDSTDDTGEYTDDDGDETQEPEESPEQKLENQQNAELLDSIINLYYSISGTCSKLDSITHVHILANKINIQVKQNLTSLRDYMYKFITNQFSSNTYVKNLYIYNYIIESYKINIEMLKKINVFE